MEVVGEKKSGEKKVVQLKSRDDVIGSKNEYLTDKDNKLERLSNVDVDEKKKDKKEVVSLKN